ncbi:MAG: 4-hydroxythreonine-4-phosphate dehydrogenase PdxA [Gammaproteobacteria bacterium]
MALTSGEPAGVGPDLCLAIAREALECELVCLADRSLLSARASALKLPVRLAAYDSGTHAVHTPDTLTVLHVPLAANSTAGQLDPANSRYVLNLIDRAIDGALSGEFDAIVTAPVQKSVINDAGFPFSGHTEYLAERTHAPLPVMMLATEDLRVALATTHLPLKDVSAAITIDSLCQILGILDHDLRQWWGIKSPRIAVCGLNPHAGESGHLGSEEINVISPAIARMRERGMNVTGPVPADTAFVPARLAECDAVLAMFHDQGLPVIKHSGFDRAVNVTLGLPILRTSVDHGTALDIAGTGRADHRSLAAAIRLALGIVARRR